MQCQACFSEEERKILCLPSAKSAQRVLRIQLHRPEKKSFVNSADPDETAHMSRLIRIYTSFLFLYCLYSVCHSVFDFYLREIPY